MTRMWVYPPRTSPSIHEFLFQSHLTHTPNISLKLELGALITIDEDTDLVYFEEKVPFFMTH